MKLCILCERCNLSISNSIFWLKGPTKKVCFRQNDWLLLVMRPHRTPIINYSVLVWLPQPRWSLVNWQKPPSKPARQKSGLTRRPSLHTSLRPADLEAPKSQNHRLHVHLLLTGPLPPLELGVSSSNFGLLSKLCTPRTAENKENQ